MASGILTALDELEDRDLYLCLGPELAPILKLVFEGREEAIGHSVVAGIVDRFCRPPDASH